MAEDKRSGVTWAVPCARAWPRSPPWRGATLDVCLLQPTAPKSLRNPLRYSAEVRQQEMGYISWGAWSPGGARGGAFPL